MRRAVVRVSALAGLLFGVVAFAQQPTETKKEATDKKAEEKAAAGSLEDLLAQALRNNPDIRVAEAKVREAEAELQRIRVVTAQKVAALRQAIETARQSRDAARELLSTLEVRYQSGKAEPSDLIKAKAALQAATAEITKLEAEMPAQLGKLPGKLGEAKAEADVDERTGSATAAALNWLKFQHSADLRALYAAQQDSTALAALALQLATNKAGPERSIADKIRKALDTPIKADFRNKSNEAVFEDLRKHLGVPLRMPGGGLAGNLPWDFDLGEVPLGVVIQAISDAYPAYRFVVRDYGILYVAKDKLPPGAIDLYDFWKSAKKAESDEEAKNPPASEIIQGVVEEVDNPSGLVRISTHGGQQGLAKGHTLEVYRESPKPMYLGRIRILDVASTRAVGKVVGKPREPIAKGDKVTSKLEGK